MSEIVDHGMTHIAGPSITVHGYLIRQRCSWCGLVLEDHDLRRMAFAIDPENPDKEHTPATWPVGGLVTVDGNMTFALEISDDPEVKLPSNACALIDPEITL